MSQRAKQALIDLQRLFKRDAGAFYEDEVCQLLAQLRDKVTLTQDRRMEERVIYELWNELDDQSQDIAWSRQRVANMVLRLQDDGYSQKAAIRVASQYAGLTHKDFRREQAWLVKDDWLALRFLGIGENFLSWRAMQIWAEEESKDRQRGWVHRFEPLHLIKPQELQDVG